MKAITMRLAVLLLLLPLTACGFTANGMLQNRLDRLNASQTEDIAQKQADELLSLADLRDTNGITALFSAAARNNGISAESMQQFIDLFCDNVVSIERLGGSESEENNYGALTRSYSYSFSVKTEHTEYLLILAGYTDDADNAQNIGVSHVVVMPRAWDAWEAYPEEADGTGIFVYTDSAAPAETETAASK